MSSDSPLRKKSFQFAVEIVKYCKILRQKREYIIANQLLCCGTSIAANIEEALRAQTRKDFLAKICISNKESGEADFWLRLIKCSGIEEKESERLRELLDEIMRMLCATIKKLNMRMDI